VQNFIYSSANRGKLPANVRPGDPIIKSFFSGAPHDHLKMEVTPEELQAREQHALEEGIRQGEERVRAAYGEALQQERGAIAKALEQFAEERKSYFQVVESEIVQLALSVAGKILHREAQVDPLVLAGVVRVALEKVGKGTQVKLLVHPSRAAEWQQHFQQYVDGSTVEVSADDSVETTCCVLHTFLGVTEISLDGQLKEIERGFLDLLAQRPQGQP
jgi:flagellar assembly protein FliH